LVTAGFKRARLTASPPAKARAQNPQFGAAPTVSPTGQPAVQSEWYTGDHHHL